MRSAAGSSPQAWAAASCYRRAVNGDFASLRSLLIAFALLTIIPALLAQEPAVELAGIGSAPIRLSSQSLAALPVAEREVTFETSKGPATRRYKGVLLWDVLQANKALDGLKPVEQLKKTFLVSARDGY